MGHNVHEFDKSKSSKFINDMEGKCAWILRANDGNCLVEKKGEEFLSNFIGWETMYIEGRSATAAGASHNQPEPQWVNLCWLETQKRQAENVL